MRVLGLKFIPSPANTQQKTGFEASLGNRVGIGLLCWSIGEFVFVPDECALLIVEVLSREPRNVVFSLIIVARVLVAMAGIFEL
jgi:hypothetical protein